MKSKFRLTTAVEAEVAPIYACMRSLLVAMTYVSLGIVGFDILVAAVVKPRSTLGIRATSVEIGEDFQSITRPHLHHHTPIRVNCQTQLRIGNRHLSALDAIVPL